MSEPLYKHYLGINRKLKPDQLGSFESSGGFVLEEKYDGWWCCVDFSTPSPRVFTRHGYAIPELPLEPLDDYKCIVIGEYMPEEKAVWLHDVVDANGTDVRYEPLRERRLRLEEIYRWNLRNNPSVRLAPQFKSSFPAAYSSIVSEGGEGVVLKHEESAYHSRLKTQKTGMWLKCKPEYGKEEYHGARDTPSVTSSRPSNLVVADTSGGAYYISNG